MTPQVLTTDHPVYRPWPGRPTVLRSAAPDADAKAFLRLYNLLMASRRSSGQYPLRQMRLSWRLVTAAFGRARPVTRVQVFQIAGPRGPIELRAYHPEEDQGKRPVFMWFHGGAFMIGGIGTTDSICRHLARASGAIVLAVRYRLAPEHDLYAGREDCLAALDWLDRNGDSLGADTTRIAIGGDSAGGNLASALAQRWREMDRTPLRMQVLIYPATNLRDQYPSMDENASGYVLDAKSIEWIQQTLDDANADYTAPWLSPLLNPDLSGLAPAVVVSAGFDPIRDDGLDYVRCLREAKVPVELLHYPGEFHGFLNFDAVLDMARDALDRIGEALARALAKRPEPAYDRTIEISSHAVGPELPLADITRDLLVASVMSGERLEQWRSSMIRILFPLRPVREALDKNQWLHPLSTLRSRVMAQVASRQALETYPAKAAPAALAAPVPAAAAKASPRRLADATRSAAVEDAQPALEH